MSGPIIIKKSNNLAICPCDGGSLQFFSPTIYKLPFDAYWEDEEAYYVESYDEYESCQRICLRDVDGNFWEGYDEAEVYLVPSCDGNQVLIKKFILFSRWKMLHLCRAL